jgi:PAS domain S-box-containing protein
MTEAGRPIGGVLGRRSRGLPRGFLALIVAVLLLLTTTGTLSWLLLVNLRNSDYDRVTLQAIGLSRTLADAAQRQIDVADLLLQIAVAEINRQGSADPAPNAGLVDAMAGPVGRLPQLSGLNIYDASGAFRFAIGETAMPRDLSWHPGFDRHRAGTEMQITAGWTDSISSLWLSRRLTDHNGLFAGVVVAALDIVADDLLDPNYLGVPISAAALVHEQGRLIIGWPKDTAAELAGLTGFIEGERGHTIIDDSILFWSRLNGFPINVLLRVEQASVESGWRRVGTVYSLLLGLLMLGAVAALWGTWRQLRRRAATEALLRGMMDNPPLIMALLAPDGRYLMINRHYAEQMQRDPEAMVGRNARDIFPSAMADQLLKQIDDTVAAGKPLVFDTQSLDLQGQPRDYIVVRFPIYDEKKTLLAVGSIATDITDRKELEEALREQSEIRQKLLENYAHQREVAETANRAKSEFLAHMSHELRTPLNAIIGFADMIAGRILGTQSEKYFEYARDISGSAHHLLGVINDILDVSKIESGRFVLEPGLHDPHDLVDDSLRLVMGRAREAGLQVRNCLPPDLPALHVDARAVKQILINLLSNAVKFTPQGGSISVEGAVTSDGGFTLAVSDTGIGIAEENLERVFEPFWQADAGIRRSEGSGLGLNICRKLIELHGGEITVSSVPQQGTRVTLQFPPDCVAAAAAQ